jgi:hypothetical protein
LIEEDVMLLTIFGNRKLDGIILFGGEKEVVNT